MAELLKAIPASQTRQSYSFDVMLRHVIGHETIKPITLRNQSLAFATARCFAAKRGASNGDDEAEIDAARKWLAKLDADTIRNNAVCDVSFSRSSGPGGQNVNKCAENTHLSDEFVY